MAGARRARAGARGRAARRLRAAAWATATLFAGFAAAQAIAIAAGRAGAPCGCFGARGRVSWSSVARSMLLALAAAILALASAGPQPPALVAALGALAGAA